MATFHATCIVFDDHVTLKDVAKQVVGQMSHYAMLEKSSCVWESRILAVKYCFVQLVPP